MRWLSGESRTIIIIISLLVSKAPWWIVANWEKLALSILGGIAFMLSFWDEDGAKYARDTSSTHKTGLEHTKEILKNKVFGSDYTSNT